MTEDRVIIFDTTLRDGEQSPGATMSSVQKKLIALTLDNMGVDVIEAGFAAASKGDFNSISAISQEVKNARVCSLARMVKNDLDLASQAVSEARLSRVHTFIATSPIHMKYKLRKEPEQVLEIIEDSIKYARNLNDDIEFSAEDASRSDIDFLARCFEMAIKHGAKTINIPDTVGYSLPHEFYDFVKRIIEKVPNSDKAIFSVHCHNDLGLAVANSLSGINAGARQIEVAVNGLGERAGNAALEEVVMALKVRSDNLNIGTRVRTEHINNISKIVSSASGFAVQRNKAIVGANAFLHESGIHQDGVLKNPATYEIMKPEDVGLSTESTIVLGKHSGRAAFKEKLDKLSVSLSSEEFNLAFQKFKDLADSKRYIQDEDIFAILGDSDTTIEERIKLVSFNVTGVSEDKKYSYLTLLIDGEEQTCRTLAKGTLDGLFLGINKLCNKDVRLHQYDVHALTDGIDALANVTVILKYKEKIISGTAQDEDTLTSSLKAYINAVNKIINFYSD